MKTKKYYLIPLLSFALVLLAIDSDAQRRGGYYNRHNNSTGLHSIEFGVGYYKPDMGYWNNESYLADQDKAFEGGIIFQGGVNFKVYQGFLIGLSAATYSDGVQSTSSIGGILRDENITYRITPLSVQGKYEFTLGNRIDRFRHTGINRLHPYIGVGINYTMVTQKFERLFADEEREDVSRNQTGSTVTFSGIGGANFDLTPTIGLGVEVNYYVGAFDQLVESGGTSTVESISLNGPAISAKVFIKLSKNRWGYRMPKRR